MFTRRAKPIRIVSARTIGVLLLYTEKHFLRNNKYPVSIKDQSFDALDRNNFSVYYENQSKHVNILNGKNTEFF